MNLLVLGATGRVGREVVTRAAEGGHNVNVLVRCSEKLAVEADNLVLFQGNVLEKKDVVKAMEGADIVVSALNTDTNNTLSKSMPLIVEAMNEQGIKRIISVGTAGILNSRTDSSLLRYQSSESKRKSTEAAVDHHQAYTILNKSALDWTIVCPTYLPDGEALGNYRVEKDFLPKNGKKISVGDTAAFLYSLLQRDDFLQTRVGIAY